MFFIAMGRGHPCPASLAYGKTSRPFASQDDRNPYALQRLASQVLKYFSKTASSGLDNTFNTLYN